MSTETERRPLGQFSTPVLMEELEGRFRALPCIEPGLLQALGGLYDLAAEKQRAGLGTTEPAIIPEARKPWEVKNDEAVLEFYRAVSNLLDGAAKTIGIPTVNLILHTETWMVSKVDPDIRTRQISMIFPYGPTEGQLTISQREPKDEERLALDTLGLDFEFWAGTSVKKYSVGRVFHQTSRGIAVHFAPYNTRWSKDILWPPSKDNPLGGNGLIKGWEYKLVDENGKARITFEGREMSLGDYFINFTQKLIERGLKAQNRETGTVWFSK